MSFAGYKSFDQCVAKNKNRGNPHAYCGAIQATAEGKGKHKKTKKQAMLDRAKRELK